MCAGGSVGRSAVVPQVCRLGKGLLERGEERSSVIHTLAYGHDRQAGGRQYSESFLETGDQRAQSGWSGWQCSGSDRLIFPAATIPEMGIIAEAAVMCYWWDLHTGVGDILTR